jgi:recombination protein RecT
MADLATVPEKTRLELLADQAQKLRPHLQQLGVNETRFIRIVTNELQRNPALGQCTPASLFAAVLRSAELNLEPGPLGLAWFIPRRVQGVDQVTWQLGYKGIVELASRAGISIQTGVVYEGEHFVEHGGTDARIEHRPDLNPKGQPIAWYAVATLPNKTKLHRVLNREEIEKRRKAGRTKFEAGKAWFDWYDSMARKTCILAMKSMLPLSAEMKVAFSADEQVQQVGLDGLKAVPDQPAQLRSGETVDRETGEIIETPPPEEQGSVASGPAADGATTDDEQLVAATDPQTQATGPGDGLGADTRPAPPSETQVELLRLMQAEFRFTDEASPYFNATLAGAAQFDFRPLGFDGAAEAIGHYATKIEEWRLNRRARLASIAGERNIDLQNLLIARDLAFAGELSAADAWALIDELEQPPVNQPSTTEAASAPAADSSPEGRLV